MVSASWVDILLATLRRGSTTLSPPPNLPPLPRPRAPRVLLLSDLTFDSLGWKDPAFFATPPPVKVARGFAALLFGVKWIAIKISAKILQRVYKSSKERSQNICEGVRNGNPSPRAGESCPFWRTSHRWGHATQRLGIGLRLYLWARGKERAEWANRGMILTCLGITRCLCSFGCFVVSPIEPPFRVCSISESTVYTSHEAVSVVVRDNPIWSLSFKDAVDLRHVRVRHDSGFPFTLPSADTAVFSRSWARLNEPLNLLLNCDSFPPCRSSLRLLDGACICHQVYVYFQPRQ